MDTDDPEIPNSLEIAHKRGYQSCLVYSKDSNAPHPNTTKITIKTIIKQLVLLGYLLAGAIFK